jgi:hypothetical protein
VRYFGPLIAFFAFVSSASAQPFFVQGTVGADLRHFSAEPEKSPFDGTSSTFLIGAGTEFIRHWVVSAEFDAGGETTTTSTTSAAFSGQTLTIHNSYSAERRTFAALAGFRSDGERRWRIGYYAGIAFSTLRRQIVSDAESVVLGSPAPGSVYDQRLTSAILAIDVAVRVLPHLAILPALRAQPLTIGTELAGHSIRPSIGARLTF